MRLILDPAATGACNMARDEALLLAGAQPQFVSTLRFYDWNPACLSLGRFQRFDELAKTSAQLQLQSGLDWVRRPTGGRAVWHQDEITYSFVVRAETLPRESQSVAGAYRFLSEAFVAGLQSLGVRAGLAPAESREQRENAQRSANCFALATRADFVVDGRKLIGAAQARKDGAILQHGALLLGIEESAWREAVGFSANGGVANSAVTNMISLRELGVQESRAEIIAALCTGVEEKLRVHLREEILSESDAMVAKGLQVKYESENWNRNAAASVEPVREAVSAL